MSFRKGLLAATILSLPLAAVAKAEPVSGLYVGAGAGVNLSHDLVAPSRDTRFALNPGYAGVLSLGYGFGNGVRAEVEGNFRENEVDHLKIRGATPGHPNGRIRSYGAMANVFYDFDMGIVQPYVGVGAGYVWSDWQKVGRFNGGQTMTTDNVDGNFAYQAIAGLALPVSNIGLAVPGLSLTAEYRFMGTLDQKVDGQINNRPAQLRFETENNYNHSIMVGLRYAFGAGATPAPAMPIAAPAAAAAPAPARTYLVFFDWDRADLTERARQVVSEAAQNSKRLQSTQIDVAGHADRSGTPQYNQRLSQQRAEKVAAELVRNGVGRNEIVVTAFGESRPLVPTSDGAREPQNRRVEIVIR